MYRSGHFQNGIPRVQRLGLPNSRAGILFSSRGFSSDMTYPVHPFSNDSVWPSPIYSNILTSPSDAKNRSHTLISGSVMVTVGESSLASIAPELMQHGIKKVYVVDYEDKLLHHNGKFLDIIKGASSLNEFNEQFKNEKKNPYWQSHHPDSREQLYSAEFKTRMKHQHQSLIDCGEEKHFMANEERFKVCKDALSKLKIEHVCLDIVDRDRFKELSNRIEQIHGKNSVGIVNITNVMDWLKEKGIRDNLFSGSTTLVKAALENIASLPLVENPLCYYSAIKTFLTKGPEQSFCFGVDALKNAFLPAPTRSR